VARAILAMALLLLVGVACSSGQATCGAIPPSVEPVIIVTDATTGLRICDAVLVAQCSDGPDAGVTVTVREQGDGGASCSYGANLDRSCYQPFTVSVSKAGYVSKTVPGVEVRSASGCPETSQPPAQQVSVSLSPG
jgi:hypothetical protein